MEIAMAQTISHRQVIKDVKRRTFQCVRDMRGLDASKQRVALENEMVFAGVLVDLCVPLGSALSDANWRKGLRLSSTRRVGRSRSSNMMPTDRRTCASPPAARQKCLNHEQSAQRHIRNAPVLQPCCP